MIWHAVRATGRLPRRILLSFAPSAAAGRRCDGLRLSLNSFIKPSCHMSCALCFDCRFELGSIPFLAVLVLQSHVFIEEQIPRRHPTTNQHVNPPLVPIPPPNPTVPLPPSIVPQSDRPDPPSLGRPAGLFKYLYLIFALYRNVLLGISPPPPLGKTNKRVTRNLRIPWAQVRLFWLFAELRHCCVQRWSFCS